MEILKTQISYVANLKEEPRFCTLETALNYIRFRTKYQSVIEQIRHVEKQIQAHLLNGEIEQAKRLNQTKKAPLKRQLPAFIFGAQCEGSHSLENTSQRTGIVCLDFDSDKSSTPAQWEDFRDNITRVKYVFYSALSVSGSGVMALLMVSNPDRQAEHFEQIKTDFTDLLLNFKMHGIKLDPSKGQNPAQLRFLTHDPEAKIKTEFAVYDRFPPLKTTRTKPSSTPQIENSKNVFDRAISYVNKQGYYFTDGEMHNSIFHLCCFLNFKGIPQHEAESFINGYFPHIEIKSNCISDPYSRYRSEFGAGTDTTK